MRRSFCLLTWAALSSGALAQEAAPLQVVPLQRPANAAEAPAKTKQAEPSASKPAAKPAVAAKPTAPAAAPTQGAPVKVDVHGAEPAPAAAVSAPAPAPAVAPTPAVEAAAAPAAAEPTSEPPAPPSKAKPAPKPRPKPAASADGAQIKIGQTITGSLTGSASRTYRFNAKAGSKVRLELTGANPLAYMTLSQPDGKAMIPEETRGLLLELPMDGVYAVKVYLFRDGAGAGGKAVDYRLRVLAVK